MYHVRDARGEELDKLARISERVLKEAPTYTGMRFDLDKTANMIAGAILKQKGWFLRVIARDGDNEPVGGLICVCVDSTFGPDKIAYDITIMLDQEHRGKCLKQLIQIIEEYKAWAIAEGAKVVKMGVSSGLSVDGASMFFERLGFARIGAMHGFVVGE